MKQVITKNGSFEQGTVKLCVPICETDMHGIETTCSLLEKGIDVVEWRMDYFQGKKITDWLQALKNIRIWTQGYILLVTWRSKQEGGVSELDLDKYEALYKAIIATELADLIDVELFRGEAIVHNLVTLAHKHDCKVILSNHDHEKTPSKEAMMIRLKAMQKMGADIAKLAVMPKQKQDVYDLLEVSSAFTEQKDSCLAITMAMGKNGVISRICGKMSGSVLSFATLNKASAPGQIAWQELRNLLDVFDQVYDNQ